MGVGSGDLTGSSKAPRVGESGRTRGVGIDDLVVVDLEREMEETEETEEAEEMEDEDEAVVTTVSTEREGE